MFNVEDTIKLEFIAGFFGALGGVLINILAKSLFIICKYIRKIMHFTTIKDIKFCDNMNHLYNTLTVSFCVKNFKLMPDEVALLVGDDKYILDSPERKKLDGNTMLFVYSLNETTRTGLYFNLKKNKLNLQIIFKNKIRNYSISGIEVLEKYKKQYADFLDKYMEEPSRINKKQENNG